MRQQRLCARIFANASLTIAVSVFERTLSPNFRLTIENVDSTFDRPVEVPQVRLAVEAEQVEHLLD